MREEKQQEVDDSLTAMQAVYDEYGYQVADIEVAEFDTPLVMACYSELSDGVYVSNNYFDTKNMNLAYDECIKNGFHPSRGNKSGLEATVAHELGHALTGQAMRKMGLNSLSNGFDTAATRIVTEAAKSFKVGVVQLGRKISEYATQSNAETIAEAFSDVHCNGNNAKAESKKVVEILNSYAKR